MLWLLGRNETEKAVAAVLSDDSGRERGGGEYWTRPIGKQEVY